MPDNKLDSGHVIVPVRHPDGSVHNVAVPEDTDLGEFHNALSDAGYTHNDLTPQTKPTAEGAIENSPAFKKAAADAWTNSRSGTQNIEAGAIIQKSGDVTVIPTNRETKSLNLPINRDTFGTLHTHPNDPNPSQVDIDAAKSHHMPFYVLSSGGLRLIDVDGTVSQIYNSPADVFDKKKKAEYHPVKK